MTGKSGAAKAPAISRIRRIHTVHSVYRALRHSYGERVWAPRFDPLDELIATILSQNTTDANSLGAFRQLKELFPTWEEALGAPAVRIEAAIRQGGLARIKARRIKAILREIQERQGNLSLQFLKTMRPKDARDYLLAFEGVGAKTAACVLLFSFGMPVLPVDTHVHRVATRLSLIDDKVSAEDAHAKLGGLVPAQLVYPFHMLMVEHGRRVCHARRPDCPQCSLAKLCKTGQEGLAARS